MSKNRVLVLLILLFLFLFPLAISVAVASEQKIANLVIGDSWARPTAGQTPNGAVYLTISNSGKTADRLTAASSPVAARGELHATIADGTVMRMRPVRAVEVAAGGKAELKPGGHHVMLLGLKAPLVEGKSFPVVLTFEKAGNVTVEVEVRRGGAMDHGSMQMNATPTKK